MTTPIMTLSELVKLRAQWRKHHRSQNKQRIHQIENSVQLLNAHNIDLDFLTHHPLTNELHEQLALYGRDWERLITLQAHLEGYSFDKIALTMPIPNLKPSIQKLESELETKNTVLLFFQSVKVDSTGDGIWHCYAWVAKK